MLLCRVCNCNVLIVLSKYTQALSLLANLLQKVFGERQFQLRGSVPYLGKPCPANRTPRPISPLFNPNSFLDSYAVAMVRRRLGSSSREQDNEDNKLKGTRGTFIKGDFHQDQGLPIVLRIAF